MAFSSMLLIVLVACLAVTSWAAPDPASGAPDVSKCTMKTIAVDASATVRSACRDKQFCVLCSVVQGGTGTCATYKDYLVNCTLYNEGHYVDYPIKLHKAILSGVMEGAFDKGFSDAGALAIGSLIARIKSLPANILYAMPGLQQVRLVGSFDTLPANFFQKNTKLTALHVDSPVDVAQLADGAVDLPSLTKLFLLGWKIGAYDGDLLKKTTNLTLLYIKGGISSMTATSLSAHSKLSQLFLLDQASLNALPTGLLDQHKRLRWVEISGSAIQTLPAGFFSKTTSIVHLELRENALKTLSEDVFSQLKALVMVTVAGNQLNALPAKLFANNTKLTELWIDSNSLSSLPAGLFNGTAAITYVYMQNNCIKSAPRDLFKGLADLHIVTVGLQCRGGITCSSFQLPPKTKCIK